MGNHRSLRKQVSQLTGFPERSLATTLLNLKKNKNHVGYDKDYVWLTDEGWRAAQSQFGNDIVAESLDTGAVLEKIKTMHKLTGAKLKIFEILSDGSAKSCDFLMDKIGCTNKKSFGTYTSALNSANLTEFVTENGIKMLQLVESSCFPFGRPV